MAAADDLEESRAALRMINPAPFNAEAPPEALAGEITPVELHYVRSNFAVPTHDGTLEIGGAVDSPSTLTLDDLRSMPAVERAVTLECAGNGRLEIRPLPVGEPWGDYAVSTARWKGALLHDVLEQAQPTRTASRSVSKAPTAARITSSRARRQRTDLSFVRSLLLAEATHPAAEILIAYEMNGEPLIPDHGAPFRLIVPHWYAVASVKWLKRIDVLTEPYEGEFQTGHYIYEWPDRDTSLSRSCVSAPASPTPSPARRSPPASTPFAERRGRHRPGHRRPRELHRRRRWHPAKLDPPTGPYLWQDWSLEWEPPNIGRHSLRARATDAAGNIQPEIPPWNRLGYGNNAIEVSYVDVS